MADEENGNGGPSLELPSLGFGRKRRKKPAETPVVAPVEPEPVAAPEPVAEREPVAAPEPVVAPEPAPEPVALAPELADEAPTATLPESTTQHPEVVDAMVPPEPSAPPLFVDEVSPAPRSRATRTAAPDPHPLPHHDEDGDADVDVDGDAVPAEPRRRATRSVPALGGMPAAVLTGLVIGLATVALTFASLNLCEAAKGTSSCGGSGFLLLVAILIAMVLLGGALLRLFRVPDPGSTSFLAVGLMAVLVLLFLVDVIFSWWMVIVIPVFAMATFALAHWVTTAFIEPADR